MAYAISWRKGQRSEDIVFISNLKAVKGVETKKNNVELELTVN